MINNKCNLTLSNLYHYDISSCFFTMLNSIGLINNKVFKSKKQRNIWIGNFQKQNKDISLFLNNNVNNIIDYYLRLNEINHDDVIVRQKDGIIITKKLRNLNDTIPIEFVGIVSKFILSKDRKSFLSIYFDDSVIVKGIRNKLYNNKIFSFFKNIDFNRSILFNQIEQIRLSFFSNTRLIDFSLLNKEDKNSVFVPIKNFGFVKININNINSIKIEDIDKQLIWDNYMWKFIESLILEEF